MIGLSVIVITRNEASNIGACLGSVDFADEIIVLDSGSTDGTQAIARDLGAKVHVTEDWPGFGKQKNRALALASFDWILSLDADERVTPSLKKEMVHLLSQPNASTVAYRCPRLSSYCGQYMRYSGWRPDFVVRLFRREHAKFSDDLVHEKLVVDGAVGTLKNSLQHQSFPDFESVLDKVNRYSTASAAAKFEAGVRSSLLLALVHGFWAFFRTYFLRLGFLDGQLGLALAISNAEGTYYRYVKLWLMARGGVHRGQ